MDLPAAYKQIGLIALFQGDWVKAVGAFQKEILFCQEIGDHVREAFRTYLLG
jgi:hypothetical protein